MRGITSESNFSESVVLKWRQRSGTWENISSALDENQASSEIGTDPYPVSCRV